MYLATPLLLSSKEAIFRKDPGFNITKGGYHIIMDIQ